MMMGGEYMSPDEAIPQAEAYPEFDVDEDVDGEDVDGEDVGGGSVVDVGGGSVVDDEGGSVAAADEGGSVVASDDEGPISIEDVVSGEQTIDRKYLACGVGTGSGVDGEDDGVGDDKKDVKHLPFVLSMEDLMGAWGRAKSRAMLAMDC